MNTVTNTKIAIIGGGASGLAAAAELSRAGRRSTVLELNARAGKKLLSTGNGRCNLGNTALTAGNGESPYSEKYHGDVRFAERVFSGWRGAERFFADLGLICRTDAEGRLYPYSNTANSVSDALRRACVKADVLVNTECRSLVAEKSGFLINGDIRAEKVIWSCGGFGADFELLRKLGHSVAEPFPSLCPVIVDKSLTRPLKGLRVRARCSAVADGKVVKSEYGEAQFNDGSLSGICIMNLSRLVRDYGGKLTISLDVAPEFGLEQLSKIPLSGLFHGRIAQILEKKPISVIKDWRFPVTGVAAREKAQVMSGGIPAAELNGDLSSKVCKNLYIIGEAVNVDGDCGGYNLEWAWASACAAVNGICFNGCNL